MSHARHVGLTGLATMGQNLARNIARHGFPIAVHNRTTSKTTAFIDDHGDEGDLVGCAELSDLVAALTPPRAIIVMVKAGRPVDAVIAQLQRLLEPGDLIVDGGNSDYRDTERRVEQLGALGVRFLGCGVSGGEEGALLGPSLMPGGSMDAYRQVADVFNSIAASVDDEPCCAYIGDGGAGHFVKMVHNGIEYADMQLIAEAYDLLHNAAGLTNDELADTFTRWNDGDLNSFLIEITAEIFRRRLTADDADSRVDDGQGAQRDHGDGSPVVEGWLVDVVADRAEQKGTGRLSVINALEEGSPTTVIAEAVLARVLSSLADQRAAAARVLPGPSADHAAAIDPNDRDAFAADVHAALYAAKIVAYAQGFDILRQAGQHQSWRRLDLQALARIWRGGCIIRARLLDRIRAVYAEEPDLENLLLAPALSPALHEAQDGWRRVVAHGARLGIPTPALSSALSYYDGYRRGRLPANLIEAQRDLFGAHTYQRTDLPGSYHSNWSSHQPDDEEGRRTGQRPCSQ